MPLPRPAPGTGRWWVVGIVGCTIGVGLAVWLGLANSLGAITFTNTGYKVLDDRSEVRDGLGGVAKSAEGADLGHGLLGSAAYDERVGTGHARMTPRRPLRNRHRTIAGPVAPSARVRRRRSSAAVANGRRHAQLLGGPGRRCWDFKPALHVECP